jgi:hypothetical protein
VLTAIRWAHASSSVDDSSPSANLRLPSERSPTVNKIAVESSRFTLRVWDWLLLVVLCAPPAFLICVKVGTPLAAVLGEAIVYFGFMAWVAYAAGRRRWQKAGKKADAGRWTFRITVLALASAAFIVGVFSGLGQSAAQAGTKQLLSTTSALRSVLDSDAETDVIRIEFNRVAQREISTAEAAPEYERPFRTVGAELAVGTLRPQLNMLQAISELGASNVLSSQSFATKESREVVLERARAVLAAGEAAKAAVETLEARARQALAQKPVQRSALDAFLHPLRRRPEHPPIAAGDPTVNRWANAIIALYEHLDQTADTWTIDPDGTLRTGVGKSDEVKRLVGAVEASLHELGAQAEASTDPSISNR